MTITKRVIATKARCRLSKNKRKDVERRKRPKEKKIGATFREIRESWLPFFFPFSLFAYPRCRSRYVATSRLAKDHGNGCESNKPCWKKRQDFAWYAMELSRRIRPARFLRRGGQPDAMLRPRIIPNICLSLSFSLILPSPTRKRNQTKTIQTTNYNNKKITMRLYHFNVYRLPDIVTACITVQKHHHSAHFASTSFCKILPFKMQIKSCWLNLPTHYIRHHQCHHKHHLHHHFPHVYKTCQGGLQGVPPVWPTLGHLLEELPMTCP